MTEAGYIAAVHRHLPSSVYKWKIADRFARGVPDVFYSGDRNSLFAEFKFLKTVPKRAFTPRLSAQQLKWLKQRHAEGRHVAVIVGTPAGGIVIPAKFIGAKFKAERWLPHKEVAQWITAQTASS